MIEKLGDPMKVYLSFQEQLEDDKDMRQLGVMYGISDEEQKQFIFEKVSRIFADYGPEYVRVAYQYLEFVGGMSALVRDVRKRIDAEVALAEKKSLQKK